MVCIFSSSFFGELKQKTNVVSGINNNSLFNLKFLNIRKFYTNKLVILSNCYLKLQNIKINTLFLYLKYFFDIFVKKLNNAKTINISYER